MADLSNCHRYSTTEIVNLLDSVGVRSTAQRLAICQYVLNEADHPTAEEVMAWAQENFPKVSLATVYNTLNTLVEAGILRTYKFPHTDKVVFDKKVESHFHFYDETTGKLLDIPSDKVQIALNDPEPGFDITGVDVLFRGTYRPHAPHQAQS